MIASGPRWSASAYSNASEQIHILMSSYWHADAEAGLIPPDPCDSQRPKCIISNGSFGVQRLMVTMFSVGRLQHSLNGFPIALHKVLSHFLRFSSYLSIFYPIASVISYIPYVMLIFCFSTVCLNLLSPLHLTLILNVVPPFFRL